MISLPGESTLVVCRMRGFRDNTGFPKKVLQWAGPGQDAVPCSLNRHFENVFRGFFLTQQQHARSKRFEDYYIINKIDPSCIAASCFAKKCRVEGARCRNLRAGWEKALQCRESSAMGITMRTFCRTDADCLDTSLCDPTKQCFETEVTLAKISS